MTTPDLQKIRFATEDVAASHHSAPANLRIKSEELLQGRGELVIDHQGREYRLRVTQNGKLILTA
jgi:hemin uptake protein HemP